MNWDEIIIELAKIACTGVVAGLFTAWIAVRDHRFKKWWELRVAAYQNLIEALSDVAYVFDTNYEAEINGRELSDEGQAKLTTLLTEGFSKVRKAADMGAFIFSDDVNETLKAFNTERQVQYQSYFEHLDGMLFATKKCLSAVVIQSRKDLSLHKTFFIWK